MKQWGLFYDVDADGKLASDIDMCPLDDTGKHDIGDTNCSCSPEIIVEGAKLIINHHAFDHREIIEQAYEAIYG